MNGTAATETTGAVTGGLRILLRLEGLTLFATMTMVYAVWGDTWWIYAVLFLAPDLSFAGYLAGPRVGALVYNVAHSYMAPMALMVGGDPVLAAACVFDRDDLAGAYRLRPRTRLRPEIQRGVHVHSSWPHRKGGKDDLKSGSVRGVRTSLPRHARVYPGLSRHPRALLKH